MIGTSNILDAKVHVLLTKEKQANSENNTKKEYSTVVQSLVKRQQELSVLLCFVAFIVDFEQIFFVSPSLVKTKDVRELHSLIFLWRRIL